MTGFMDVIASIGAIQRFDEAIKAEKQGTWAGHQYGNIPVLGGLLHPAATAANAVGLGLEGLGTTGKAIAGEAALPAAYLQSAYDKTNLPGVGANPAVSQTAEQITSVGLGEALRHPGRTVDALRTSRDSPTAYLGGALEMASDPTNVLAAPVAGYFKASKAAGTVARNAAGATVSEGFTAAKAAEDAAAALEAINPVIKKVDKKEAAKAAWVQHATSPEYVKQIDDILMGNEAQRAAAEGADAAAKKMIPQVRASEENVAQFRARYGSAGDLYKTVAAEKKAAAAAARAEAKGLGRDFKNQYVEAAKDEVTAKYPDGPARGVKMREYVADKKKAWQDAVQQDAQVLEVYGQAKLRAGANATGTVPGKGFTNLVSEMVTNENTARAAEQGIIPPSSRGLGIMEPVDAALRGPLDPQAGVLEGMQRLQHATPLGPPAPANMLPENMQPEPLGTMGGRMKDLISYAFQEGLTEQRAAMGRKGAKLGFSEMASIWKGITTQTMRNIFQDEAFARLLLADAGVRGREYNRNYMYVAKRAAEGGGQNPLLMLGDVSDVLAATGWSRKLPKEKQLEILDNIGISMMDAETDNIRQLSAMQHLMGSVAVQGANPLRGSVSMLTAPLGYLGPMRQRMFHIVNNVTHMASRGEAFKQGYIPYLENSAKNLLATAEAEGLDTALLRGRGMVDPFDATKRIISEGAFSPEEATQFLGARFGTEWERMTEEAMQAGYKRTDEVFGNYSRRGPTEQAINKFFPFMSWSWRAYPRVARMVLQHPAVTAGLVQLYEADAKAADAEGRPSYQIGTLRFDRDTPFVGLLARVFSPEQEAEVRLNPVALFSPLGGEAIGAVSGMGDQGANDTLYQKAMNVAGIAGLSPSPVLQAGAYVLGDKGGVGDWKSPGPLSRYSAIDQLPNDLGLGFADVPSFAQGPLRKLRELASGQKDTYDPVRAKAYELVLEQTGLPVSDTRNKPIAMAIEAGTSPFLKQAERVLDVGGSIRTAYNAVSPTSVQVTSNTAVNKRQAAQGIPFTYEEIQAFKASDPQMARVMEQQNKLYLEQHPAAAVSVKPTITPRDRTIAQGAALRAAGLR